MLRGLILPGIVNSSLHDNPRDMKQMAVDRFSARGFGASGVDSVRSFLGLDGGVLQLGVWRDGQQPM